MNDDRNARDRGLDGAITDLGNAAASLLGALVDLLDDVRRALQRGRSD
jgi:hypothetical protein